MGRRREKQITRNIITSINALFRLLKEFTGAPGRIRTPDPLIRSQVLYPAELPVRTRLMTRRAFKPIKGEFARSFSANHSFLA